MMDIEKRPGTEKRAKRLNLARYEAIISGFQLRFLRKELINN